MNKWNKLLAMLDAVFGFENKVKSNFKKIKQDFDDQTNEHVILIEYQVQVKGTMNTTPSKGQVNQQTMLQQLYAQAHANQNQNQKKKKKGLRPELPLWWRGERNRSRSR